MPDPQIYKDHNGVTVTAIAGRTFFPSGIISNVTGHYYEVALGEDSCLIKFQYGPVPKSGVNGLTNEALLAILIHRTKFLDAKFGCDENQRAIQHMEEALVNLEVRTARRMVRGVEGKEEA
jgi:hypothetical protein